MKTVDGDSFIESFEDPLMVGFHGTTLEGLHPQTLGWICEDIARILAGTVMRKGRLPSPATNENVESRSSGKTWRPTAYRSGLPGASNGCGFIDSVREIGELSGVLGSSARLGGMKHFIYHLVCRCYHTHILQSPEQSDG
jgi:hypothetical protein